MGSRPIVSPFWHGPEADARPAEPNNLPLIAAFPWTTVPVRISIKIDQTARTSGENGEKIVQKIDPTSVTGRRSLPATGSDQKWPLNDDGSARHGQHGEKMRQKMQCQSASLANIETSFAPKWAAAMATSWPSARVLTDSHRIKETTSSLTAIIQMDTGPKRLVQLKRADQLENSSALNEAGACD